MAAVAAAGNATYADGVTVAVTRGYLSTAPAAHSLNAAIRKVTGTPVGSAASPAPCAITATVTLQPGTYYGGINIGGNANVTLATGTYIMAGGGLKVTGAAQLHAPNVLLYNTNDTAQPTGNGAVDQILLNTTGSVTLGPQTTGPHQGLTIFQDRTQAVSDTTCDSRKNLSTAGLWDIAFLNMASTGANGALGSVSGTIYAPHPHALFGDAVSGTANLAIITGCIHIDGANSTFDFKAGGLFGTGSSLTE